uniref:Uncharacterized protein n=1 Tax=Leersia perrieri TaxID=77586 RepID=A0A0D9VEZ6_9ORYZ
MTNLEGFLKEGIDKLQKELHKVKSEADESETKLLLFQALDGHHPRFEGLTINQLTNLAWMVDAHLKIVNNRLEELRRQGLLPAPTPLLATGTLPHDIVDYTNVEKPPSQQEGSLMDVGRSIGSLGHDGFGASSGSRSSTAGPNGDMVQVFSSGAGSSSANQGFLFPPK